MWKADFEEKYFLNCHLFKLWKLNLNFAKEQPVPTVNYF